MKLTRAQKRDLRSIIAAAVLFLVLLLVRHLTPGKWWQIGRAHV